MAVQGYKAIMKAIMPVIAMFSMITLFAHAEAPTADQVLSPVKAKAAAEHKTCLNIGYPGQPEEIDWFIQMMRKAAPNMSQDDLKAIETALKSCKKT